MAKDNKAKGAEDRARSDMDPDVLAIRALMEAQEFDIAPKSDDHPPKTQSRSSQEEPPSSAHRAPARPTTPEIRAAIGTMMSEAEEMPLEETSPQPDPAQTPAEGRVTARTAHPFKSANITRVLAQLGRFSWQVLRHPKTPPVVLVVLLLTAFILRPVVMILFALLLILAAAVIYFSVGPEAVDGFILRRFDALRKRNPDKADQLRGRTIRGISTLNKLIDRLPDRWTAGLYLPDLEEPVVPPEKMQDDPFERLEPVAGGQYVVRKACPLPPDPRERKASPTDAPRRPPRQIRP